MWYHYMCNYFFFNDTYPTEIYPLPHTRPLPIFVHPPPDGRQPQRLTVLDPDRQERVGNLAEDFDQRLRGGALFPVPLVSSEEHTLELQSPCKFVCRLLLEKKKHVMTCS